VVSLYVFKFFNEFFVLNVYNVCVWLVFGICKLVDIGGRNEEASNPRSFSFESCILYVGRGF
jgi:hypothetical protein